MSDQARKSGEQHLRYKLKQRNKLITFDILNNSSEYVALVNFMVSPGNVNN